MLTDVKDLHSLEQIIRYEWIVCFASQMRSCVPRGARRDNVCVRGCVTFWCQDMCDVDVLDLSVRCQSHSLSTISNIDWTSPTTLSVAQLSTSPPRWSNCVVNHGAHYDLEPVSPSSSPGSQPSSCVVRRDLDAFLSLIHI